MSRRKPGPARDAALPPLLRAVKREGRKLLWVSDPMHGNTIKTSNGFKTRPTERIAQEVRNFFGACSAEGVYAAALPDGRAVALKIADGGNRARPAVMVPKPSGSMNLMRPE